MKKNMTLHLIMQLKPIESLILLNEKLPGFATRGWNWIVTLFSRPWSLKDPSSSYSYQSFEHWEIPDYERPVLTSAETNKPTSLPTHLSVKRLDLRVTRPSTISDALRSRGSFNPSRGKAITDISPVISGFQVQILYINGARLKD